jgi:hypothetical protein
MPRLASHRDGHDTTGLNAAPRTAGMAPARHADTLRTAGRRDTGHDMRSFGAQLNPTSSRLGHRRGLEQHYAIRQYRHQIPAATSADRTGSLPPAKMSSIMDAFAQEHPQCESRTAAVQ